MPLRARFGKPSRPPRLVSGMPLSRISSPFARGMAQRPLTPADRKNPTRDAMMDFLSLVAAQFHIAHFLPVEAIIRSQKRDNLDLIPRGGNGLAQDFHVWFFKNARQFDGSGDGLQLPAVRSFLTRFQIQPPREQRLPDGPGAGPGRSGILGGVRIPCHPAGRGGHSPRLEPNGGDASGHHLDQRPRKPEPVLRRVGDVRCVVAAAN